MIFSNFNLALPEKKSVRNKLPQRAGFGDLGGTKKKKKVKCKLCGLEMIHSHN